MPGHEGLAICFAENSSRTIIVTGGNDKTVRIWNTIIKKEEAIFRRHKNTITDVMITSDDSYAISKSSNKEIFIWNILCKNFQEEVTISNASKWKKNRPDIEAFLAK